MSKNKSGSPRKFSEKIALLNKKEAEANAEFEKILKEVEASTRTPSPARQLNDTNSYQMHYGYDDHQQSHLLLHHPSMQQPQSLTQHHHHQQQQPQQQQQQHLHHLQQQSPQLQHQQPLLIHHQQHHHHQLSQPQQDLPHQHLELHRQLNEQLHLEHVQQPHLIQQQEGSPGSSNWIADDADYSTNAVAFNQAPVPNIKIFPTDDHDNTGLYHQQVNGNTGLPYSNDCYPRLNPISSARSLPDIANLRASNGSPASMLPSYSDQKIHTNRDVSYNYDTNNVWHNNNHSLGAPTLNTNLSKSLDVCYTYSYGDSNDCYNQINGTGTELIVTTGENDQSQASGLQPQQLFTDTAHYQSYG